MLIRVLIILLWLWVSIALAQTPAVNSTRTDLSYSYQTPITGFSITIAGGVGYLILDPIATLATGTIIMQAAPVDGQIQIISSSQIITALTVSPNASQSLKGAPTTIALGGRIECIYRLANTTWYC